MEKELESFYEEYYSENWKNAEEILKNIYKKKTKTFWYYSRISSVCYEQRDYNKALIHVEKAFRLNPNSPLVLWDYAGALYMLDEEERAIVLWEKLISLGEKKIGAELTSEGIMWARTKINDSYFRIGEAYFYLGKNMLALENFNIHLSNRKNGLKSYYKKNTIIKYIKKLNAES